MKDVQGNCFRGLGMVIVMVGMLACNQHRGMQSTVEVGTGSEEALQVNSGVRKVGGPCEYTNYEGTAVITRVEKTERSRAQAKVYGGPGYEGFEVWFTFTPQEGIASEWARRSMEEEHLFLLANSWYPGSRYLEKYGISTGTRHPCVLKVISRGTCTPLIFEFSQLNRDDYFEGKQ